MKTIECDVLVVGAGASGSVAALTCALNGLDTLLVEKNTRLGQHVNTKLDASSHDGLPPIIDELGLMVENTVYQSKWHPPSGNYFHLKSDSPEYFFKRGPEGDSFDVSTAGLAVEKGCKLLLGTTLSDITEAQGRIHSVEVTTEGEKFSINPKIIVAADGGNSMFHRFVYKRSEDRRKVGYGVTGRNFSDTLASNVYFDAELLPGGYFYLITGESGVSSACIVLDSAHMKKPAKEYYQEYLSANVEIREKVKGASIHFWGEGAVFDLDRLFHNNLVFVGEAAGLLDPFFGYGMASAVISGYHAGRSIKKKLSTGGDALHEYEVLMKEIFDQRLSYLYQRAFENLKNDDFNLLAELLNELDERVDVDKILKLLSGDPMLLKQLKMLKKIEIK